MFNIKKESLRGCDHNRSFVKEAIKLKSQILSGNGALKYSTTNNVFVDDFASLGTYLTPRTFDEVARTMEILWKIDPVLCVKEALYCRLVARKTILMDGTKLDIQRGQGLKAEAIWRFMWLGIFCKKVFRNNLHLLVSAGCWNDIIELMSLDLQYNGYNTRILDWSFLLNFIAEGIKNPNTSNLVKKYIPTLKSISKCSTLESHAHRIIAIEISKKLFGNNRKRSKLYRKLKSSGKAHKWQQLITKNKIDKINFDEIAGRALNILVNTKFIEHHNLSEKYLKWLENKPIVKYTGFVHELFKPLIGKDFVSSIVRNTIDKQFEGLLETAKKDTNCNNSLLVALDVSGSMDAYCASGMTSYNIGKALALFFSSMIEGPFADAFVTFSDTCEVVQFHGKDVVDKWNSFHNFGYGSTDFLQVAELFANIKKNVNEKDFPTGLLCISDGEFNNCGDEANFDEFRNVLRRAGFSKEYVDNFKIILWDTPNYFYGEESSVKFESFADCPNNFYIGGFSPSVISFIMGNKYQNPKTAEELFDVAMHQRLLNKVVV